MMWADRSLEARRLMAQAFELRALADALPRHEQGEKTRLRQEAMRLEAMVRRLAWIPAPLPIVRK